MIKLNLNRYDIAELMKVLPEGIASWDEDALVVRIGKNEFSLTDLNLELKTKAYGCGLVGDVQCRGKNGNVEIDVELQ